MSVDVKTVRHVANLARIAIPEDEIEFMQNELNNILGFVEQLNEVDITNVEPMVSVMHMSLPMRHDKVSDGNKAAQIVSNAPLSEDNFFMVPKVVE